MWSVILLLGAFSIDYMTAAEIQHGNYLLNIENGTLRGIKPTGDSVHMDLSGLKLETIEEKVFDNISGVKNLNLSKNELTELSPSVFSKLTQLEILSLAENHIWQLEENTFKGLDKLKSLNLSNNSLRYLQKGVFYGLTKFVNIIASGNDLAGISTGIFVDPTIEEPRTDEIVQPYQPKSADESITTEIIPVLDANIQVKVCKTSDGIVNSVEELKKDDVLGSCVKVPVYYYRRTVDLSSFGLKKFLKGWYKLSALPISGIDLSDNNITEITPELLNDLPTGLTRVNLERNKLEIVKKNVIENQYLKDINIAHNFISTIEEGALQKTTLTQLYAVENRLKDLTFAKTLPSTLQILELGGNAIVNIPEDCMKKLQNLITINLSRNNVTILPVKTLKGLKKLETITLSDNQLMKIYPGTFQDQEELSFVDFSSNRISDINSGVFTGLKMLRIFNLADNKIKRISKESVAHSKEISEGYTLILADNKIETIEKESFVDVGVGNLFLENNRIAAIPEGAFNTSSLISLNLRMNLLTMIDGDSFAGLPNLGELVLAENKISSIKKGVAKNLRSLQHLDISFNPIERLDNGALYGLRTEEDVFLTTFNVSFKVIEGGVFEDV